MKYLLIPFLACVLALGACAGKYDITPGAEAYLDMGGQRAAAVGVEGPRVQADSDGLIVGAGSPDAARVNETLRESKGSVDNLSATVSGAGTVIVIVLLIVALGIGAVIFFTRKKD